MHLGVTLPVEGPSATRDALLEAARLAEDLGFHSIWTSDRVLLPAARPNDYPYSQERAAVSFDPDRVWLEPIAVMGMAAAVTKRVTIGTNVLVASYRNPIILAQELATLDHISDGRILLGLGIGWMHDEFSSLGIPFAERAPRTDEYIATMRALWRGGSVTFHGRYTNFDDMVLPARPKRFGGPPILIGGNSEPAFRRVARLGDGWAGGDMPPSQAATAIRRLRDLYAEHGRDITDSCLSLKRRVDIAQLESEPARLADALRTELDGYEAAGAALVIFDITPATDQLAAINWLADTLVPAGRS